MTEREHYSLTNSGVPPTARHNVVIGWIMARTVDARAREALEFGAGTECVQIDRPDGRPDGRPGRPSVIAGPDCPSLLHPEDRSVFVGNILALRAKCNSVPDETVARMPLA